MQDVTRGPRTGVSVPASRIALVSARAGTAGYATGTTRLGIDAAACATNKPAPAVRPDGTTSAGRPDRAVSADPLIRHFTAKIHSDREVPA